MNIFRYLGCLGNIFLRSGSDFRKHGGAFGNVHQIKRVMAIIIAMICLIGIALSTIGISNLVHERLKVDPTPTGKWQEQNNILLTAIGIFYLFISCFGYIGIWEGKSRYNKVFMMMSVAFGVGTLQTFIIWLATIKILVPEQDKMNRKIHYEKTHMFYMLLIFLSAIFQVICSFLSYLISVTYTFSRGYYTVTQDEADLADFFETFETSSSFAISVQKPLSLM